MPGNNVDGPNSMQDLDKSLGFLESIDVSGNGDGSSRVCIFEASSHLSQSDTTRGQGFFNVRGWNGSSKSVLDLETLDSDEDSSCSFFDIPTKKTDRKLRSGTSNSNREQLNSVARNDPSTLQQTEVCLLTGILPRSQNIENRNEYIPKLAKTNNHSKTIQMGKESANLCLKDLLNLDDALMNLKNVVETRKKNTQGCILKRGNFLRVGMLKQDEHARDTSKTVSDDEKLKGSNERCRVLKPPQRKKTQNEDEFLLSLSTHSSLRRKESYVSKSHQSLKTNNSTTSEEPFPELRIIERTNSLSSLSCISYDSDEFNSSSGTIDLNDFPERPHSSHFPLSSETKLSSNVTLLRKNQSFALRATSRNSVQNKNPVDLCPKVPSRSRSPNKARAQKNLCSRLLDHNTKE